jgi:hypothetical protein
MKNLFLISFILVSFVSAHAEDSQEVKDCRDAIDRARKKVNDYADGKASQMTPSSVAPPPQSGGGQSGQNGQQPKNSFQALSEGFAKQGELEAQKSDEIQKTEDNCEDQANKIEEKIQEFRQSDYERRMQLNLAETEQKKQISDIVLACHTEASKLLVEERTVSDQYVNRIVSSVGGAANSANVRAGRRNYFFNQCYSSEATREAMKMTQLQLETKRANFILKAQEVMSDVAFQESRTAKLGARCAMQHDRIEQKFGKMQAQLQQANMMNMIGAMTSIQTSSASAANQQQAAATYDSVSQVLEPKYWDRIETACLALGSDTSSKNHTENVPEDIYPAFKDVNRQCRPQGAPAAKNCVGSSGRVSTEASRNGAFTQ